LLIAITYKAYAHPMIDISAALAIVLDISL
jgi:hypothetical protein